MVSFRFLANTLLPLAAATFAAPAAADDWPCTVLLCLSNPAGATAENECVPPIEKLWKHLAKGGGMPTCVPAGPGAMSARIVAKPYDDCPPGYTPAAAGAAVVRGRAVDPAAVRFQVVGYAAVSEKNAVSGEPSPRACVTAYQGTYIEDSDYETRVQVYGDVIWQEWQAGQAIEMYVDGALRTTTRF